MGSPRVEDEEDLDRDAAAAPSGAAGTAVPYLDQQVAAGLASEGAPVWVETRGRETEAELYAAMCTGFMAGEEDFTAEARTTREQDGVEWPEGGVDHIRARLLNAEGQEVAVSNAMGLAPTRTRPDVTVSLESASSTPAVPSAHVVASRMDLGLHMSGRPLPTWQGGGQHCGRRRRTLVEGERWPGRRRAERSGTRGGRR